MGQKPSKRSPKQLAKDALDYHASGRPGKIEVIPSKSTHSQRDLSLAYSPGVAEPCRRIAEDPSLVYKYTTKGNLVAVISNGTAVLGLGDIGPKASKPVMEGKGLLFKIFADIDVFDLELDVKDPQEFVQIVKALEPTFGGINLEDIKAPECFEIERLLKESLSIPVMHDDQHGTAIISAAALLNALHLQKKKIDKVKFVISGAGAAAISCCKLYMALGARQKNMFMFDSKGLIHNGRKDLDPMKQEFALDYKDMSLAQAMKDADVFIGLSKGGVVGPAMLKSMARKPIVFAMANPDPEIDWDEAVQTRSDLIMATGRSDYPNQVNNVLGFPFIFRGALDVQASSINEAMKLAAVHALSELAREPVPESVNLAYNHSNLVYGKEYIIPKPVDPRLITHVAPAVARAAMISGVARKPIADWTAYKEELLQRLGLDDRVMRAMANRARQNPKKLVFAEADNLKILKSAQIVKDEGLAYPILLGNKDRIKSMVKEHGLDLDGITIIDPKFEELKREEFGELFYQRRKRRGITQWEANKLMRDRTHYGAMMVQTGEADAMLSGLTRRYPETIRPALQAIGTAPGVKKVAGMYVMITRKGPFFFADTTVNVDPTAEEIADITLLVADAVHKFHITPRVALLSYSNFGSSEGPSPDKMRKAVEILHQKAPGLQVDGEIQANFALNKTMLADTFPFAHLPKGANTLIFPNLDSGNIAYKLLQELGSADAVGPILLGLNKPVHVLQLGSSVREIINMCTLAVVDAQEREYTMDPKRKITAKPVKASKK